MALTWGFAAAPRAPAGVSDLGVADLDDHGIRVNQSSGARRIQGRIEAIPERRRSKHKEVVKKA
jgi:hypothetical protein